MRNPVNRLWIAALGLLVLSGQSALRADDAKPDAAKSVTLAHPLKAKENVQYKYTLNISAGGTDILVEQNRKQTVKEVKDNGDVVIVIADLGGKVAFGGNDMDTPPGSPITITQSKSGKLLTYVPEAEENQYFTTPTMHLVEMANHIVLSDKPVKPGDSWTTEVPNPAAKGKKVTIKTTYVADAKLDGTAVWKVKQTLEAETESGETMKAVTTASLDAATGQLIQAEHELTGVPTKMGSVDWKAKVQRAKPEAAKTDK